MGSGASLAWILIISSIAFMAYSVYALLIERPLASMASLASGILLLGGGINLYKFSSRCGEKAAGG